ncbi:MAG: Sec-independent protein translocase subunit TatA/TatB [Microthrixaceae bacterium]
MLPAAQFGLIVENIGAGEIVVIAFLALVILGPDRIPEMARGAGRLLHNAKKFTSNLSGDMADVINDPAMQPIKELGEFAARPRQKITEYALEAEAEERQKTAAEQDTAGTAANATVDPEDADSLPAETANTDVSSSEVQESEATGSDLQGSDSSSPKADEGGSTAPADEAQKGGDSTEDPAEKS